MESRFKHFDPGERFWTPGRNVEFNQSETIMAVRLNNGFWHKFDGFVCRRVAEDIYQKSIREPFVFDGARATGKGE